MSIYDKIINKGRAESDSIRQDAERESKAIEHTIVAEAEREAALLLAKADENVATSIAQAEALSELEKRQSVAALKNKSIDEIFNAVLDHFKSLKGSDLLSFVVKQIQDEKIKGDEIMRVNARDYERYRLALSSQDLAHNVVLDRLNKALGKDYHLVLEDVSSNEEEGFLLLGDTYDLNFSVKPILDRLRKRKEKELFASLFENEGE